MSAKSVDTEVHYDLMGVKQEITDKPTTSVSAVNTSTPSSIRPTITSQPAGAISVCGSGTGTVNQDTSEQENDKDGLPGPPPLTPAMQATVDQLRELQEEHLTFEKEYMKEWNALKLKYLHKFRPLYSKRREVLCSPDVAGEIVAEEKEVSVGTVKIPSFWTHTLKNHRIIAEMIRPHDEPVLKYLEDIQSEWLDDDQQMSFRLSFVFASNPYFDHSVLTKTYHMDRDEDGEGVLMSTEGSEITWNAEKDITKVVVTKKQRNLKTRQTRFVKETRTVESFFDFFKSYEFPTPEQFEKMNSEEAKLMEDNVEAEFDVGCILREKIIPHALRWFMGEEDDEMSDDETESDSSEGSEDSDEEQDDEESENDSSGDGAPQPPRRGKWRGKKGGRRD